MYPSAPFTFARIGSWYIDICVVVATLKPVRSSEQTERWPGVVGKKKQELKPVGAA